MEPSVVWGVAWGDSWGWAWGPLHEVDAPPEWDTSQGKAGRGVQDDPDMSGYVARLAREREAYNLTRLHVDDQAAVEFILSLVQMEFLDGTF